MAQLLKAARLARSTFYCQCQELRCGDSCAGLKAQIQGIFDKHKGRYGYRGITAHLRQAGCVINHKTVQRLMQMQGLKSLVRPKKYRSYRGPVNAQAPHLLQRQFQADAPQQKWVTDVTEFNVRGSKPSTRCSATLPRWLRTLEFQRFSLWSASCKATRFAVGSTHASSASRL